MAKMTLDDKLALVDGVGFSSGTAGYVGHIAANPELCIPALNLEDGPQGVADSVPGVTQLPAAVALAASWDPALARAYGAVVGSEDPYLAGQTAVGFIGGVHRQGVMSQVKHLAVYNQETSRNTAADDAVVSQRAMQEIYLPQFEAAVTQGQAASVMCSYSSVNGQFACENRYLLTNVLRQQWHFGGFVTSDWDATHSTVPSALNGLDMQMPGGSGFGTDYYGAPLKQAVTPEQGISKRGASGVTVSYAQGDVPVSGVLDAVPTSAFPKGLAADYYNNTTRTGTGVNASGWSAKFTGTISLPAAGPYDLSLSFTGTAAVSIGGKQVFASQQQFNGTERASVAVVFASDFETEGADLPTIDLPASENQLIAAVAAARPDRDGQLHRRPERLRLVEPAGQPLDRQPGPPRPDGRGFLRQPAADRACQPRR